MVRIRACAPLTARLSTWMSHVGRRPMITDSLSSWYSPTFSLLNNSISLPAI